VHGAWLARILHLSCHDAAGPAASPSKDNRESSEISPAGSANPACLDRHGGSGGALFSTSLHHGSLAIMANRRELEEEFITESRVFVGLFGSTYRDQLQWALGVMSAEAAGHYMESWWQGRQNALRYLRWMADRLRSEAGSDAGAWLEQFTSTSGAVLKRMEVAPGSRAWIPSFSVAR
jgi:hypothetical protein